MIKKIVEFSVYNRTIVLIFTFIICIFGWKSFQSLPIDAVPDITNIQVQVNTPVEGFVPEEIERNITFPIESSMNGIAGVSEVRSLSKFGLSQVTIIFEDGTDIYKARQLVNERLQSIELPEGIRPVLGPVSTGLGEIFHYAIEAEEIKTGKERIEQLMELRSLQDWYIKPRILTVKGVAEVNTIGGFEKQYHIQPNPKMMAKYGIHFDDFKDIIQNNNYNVGGGYVQQTGEQFLVQGVGLFEKPDDIKNVVIKSLENFKSITIGDVAQVQLAKELRTGAALVNGQETVLGTAFMLLGENSRTVSLQVAEKIEEIKKNLPKGIKLETLYDRSDLVNKTLDTVQHNLMMGAILVIIFLLFLVGNIRAALITAFIIFLTLLGTFIIMRIRGISGNLMSLGALDFGIIVDGAVIVLDNCVRIIEEKSKELGRSLTRLEVKETIIEATQEIRKAAGFGELIIVMVFIPLFALTGIEGKMFVPMAATFSIAVTMALIFSFTTVPALASTFLSGQTRDKKPWPMLMAEKIYAPILNMALRLKYIMIIIGIFAITLGIFLFSKLGGEFLPKLDEGSLAIQFVRPANISIDNSIKLQEITERVIKENFPEVSIVFSRIGTAEIATDPMGVNLSDTYVMLKDKKEWPQINGKNQSKDDLAQRIVKTLESEVPGQRLLVTQPIQMRFNELLEGTRADVSVKIYGEDMDKLVQLSETISKVISTVPGAGEVETEFKGNTPLLRVFPKKDELRRLGLNNQEILHTVQMAIGGVEIGQMYEGVKRFPLILRLSEEDRANLELIKLFPVGLPGNYTLPLSNLSEIRFEETATSISRENAKRRSAVLINPRGRDTESFVQEAQKTVEEKVKLPQGYFIEWGGNFKNLIEAKKQLLVLAPLTFVIILLMVFFAFKNIYQVLLIVLCAPLALVGGVISLMIQGLPFSISAGVGFIALSGIAVLNGVVLISYFNQLRLKGLKGIELVKEGALIRLRPVLMTALIDIFGFLPMMFSSGLGADVQRPLATVVVGGIISATILTLVLLPTLYWIFESKFNNSVSN